MTMLRIDILLFNDLMQTEDQVVSIKFAIFYKCTCAQANENPWNLRDL